MKTFQLLSRRNTERKVDFRPDKDAKSPFVQLRRLSALLGQDVLSADDIDDCDEAINAYRELIYRKIFTGTSHEQFIETDETDPMAIDWLIAVHAVDADIYRNRK